MNTILPRLTPRETEVIALLPAGHTNREIANQLAIKENTVESHLDRIYRKLGVSSRTQAACTYLREQKAE